MPRDPEYLTFFREMVARAAARKRVTREVVAEVGAPVRDALVTPGP